MLAKRFSDKRLEAGTDEAGRGCLAGPVVAAAVILPEDFENGLLNDSKKLSEKNRMLLKEVIENEAISYAVSFVGEKEIDQVNILNASLLAMSRSLEQLEVEPEFILVDGNRFSGFRNVPHQTIVKGDAKYMSIAAASILAKTYRDAYMKKIHEEFPMYEWQRNKGYPTAAHRKGIALHGPCLYHRKSFQLLPSQLRLDLT